MFPLTKETTKFGNVLLAYRVHEKVFTFALKDRPRGSYSRYACVACRTAVRNRSSGASKVCRVIRVSNGTTTSVDDPSTGHNEGCNPPTSSKFLAEQIMRGAAQEARTGAAAAPIAIAAEHLSRLPARTAKERSSFPDSAASVMDVQAACSDPETFGRRLRKAKSSAKNAIKMRNKFDIPNLYKKTLDGDSYLMYRDETLGIMMFGSPESVC